MFATNKECGKNSVMLKAITDPDIKLKILDSIYCPKHHSKRARECIKQYDITAGLEDIIVINVGARGILRKNIDVSLGLIFISMRVEEGVMLDLDNKKRNKSIEIKFRDRLIYELAQMETKFEIINITNIYREQCVLIGYNYT